MAVDRQPSGDLGLGLAITFIILVFISLILRIFARVQLKAGPLAQDDLVIIVGALSFFALNGVFLEATLGKGSSGGTDLSMMSVPQVGRYFKYLFISEHLFLLSITSIKLSILLFYRRIFSIRRSFLRLNWVAIAICIIWHIVSTFVIIFQCSPVHAMWDMTLKMTTGKCMSPGRLVFGIEVSNIAVDLLILALPVYMVQQLQMKTAKKLSIISIFLLGGFVCIASGVRSYYSWEADTGAPHPTTMTLNWSTIELGAACICASLPTYGPIFAKVRQKLGFSQYKSSPSGDEESKPPGGQLLNRNGEYGQLVDQPSTSYVPIVTTRTRSGRRQSESYEMERIHVQHSVEVI